MKCKMPGILGYMTAAVAVMLAAAGGVRCGASELCGGGGGGKEAVCRLIDPEVQESQKRDLAVFDQWWQIVSQKKPVKVMPQRIYNYFIENSSK